MCSSHRQRLRGTENLIDQLHWWRARIKMHLLSGISLRCASSSSSCWSASRSLPVRDAYTNTDTSRRSVDGEIRDGSAPMPVRSFENVLLDVFKAEQICLSTRKYEKQRAGTGEPLRVRTRTLQVSTLS